MKKTGLIFLAFLLAFLSACGASERKALEKNRSLWESQAIDHYRFNLKVGCNCPWYDLMPLTVEVKNGEIISMVAGNGGDITPLSGFLSPAWYDRKPVRYGGFSHFETGVQTRCPVR